MDVKYLPLLILCLTASACDSETVDRTTLDYFQQHLTPDMSYSSLITSFGQPSDDVGSGVHIYVYPLRDGTEVWIGFTDKVIYAKHVDTDKRVLRILI